MQPPPTNFTLQPYLTALPFSRLLSCGQKYYLFSKCLIIRLNPNTTLNQQKNNRLSPNYITRTLSVCFYALAKLALFFEIQYAIDAQGHRNKNQLQGHI